MINWDRIPEDTDPMSRDTFAVCQRKKEIRHNQHKEATEHGTIIRAGTELHRVL